LRVFIGEDVDRRSGRDRGKVACEQIGFFVAVSVSDDPSLTYNVSIPLSGTTNDWHTPSTASLADFIAAVFGGKTVVLASVPA
jgi:hypothetical protein